MTTPRTRHIGVAALTVQGIIPAIATQFCASYEPMNPASLMIAGFTAVLTVVDFIRNSGKN